MSDLGDLTRILDEEPVANLDWLVVDEEEYRALEALPQQNLDSIPELVAQWKNLSEADQYRLSPENRRPDHPETDFWSERPLAHEITPEIQRDIVGKFAKQHVQAGVPANELIEILKKNFDAQVLANTQDTIRDVLAERGLLGSVYIDSELFEDCYKGGPQKGLTASNRDAKFVVGKSDCHDCIHNRKGRCSVFQKEIVFDVKYDQDLWEEYRERLEIDKNLAGLDDLPVKARIQKALLRPKRAEQAGLDNKPVMPDPTQGMSYEEAQARLAASDVKQQVVENVYLTRQKRRLARRMMAGDHGPQVQELIDSNPVLATLKKDLFLLGQLHVDLSHFPTYREASEFVSKLDNPPPVLVGIPYEEDQSTPKYGQARSLNLKDPKTLFHIVDRYMLVNFGKKSASQAEKFKGVAKKLVKAGTDNLRKFAQVTFSKPVPKEARKYEATLIYDPTQGMSSEEADQKLREAKVSREVLADPRKVAARRDVVSRMLKGIHDAKTRALIASEDHLSDLRSHLHLLGKLYVDTRVATTDQIRKAANANPEVEDLPYLTDNNSDIFFQKPQVHAQIAKRLAAIKGIHEEPAYTQFLRKIVALLEGQPETKVKAFARKAFRVPVKEQASSRGGSVGLKDMSEFELGVTAHAGVGDLIELHSGPQEGLDNVEFGDGMILD